VNVLFDSQALIDWMMGKRFRPAVRRAIERSGTDVFISVITPWEMLLKPQLRKFGITTEKLWGAVGTLGANILPVRKEHVQMHADLPFYPEHRDPFDRMLVAQAIVENLTMVGGDMRFELYRDLKVLW